MQFSAEVRWFHRGNLTDQTMSWFADGKTLGAETRTDRYLVFPGTESGGVKLRTYKEKRNLEVKLLRGAAEPISLTPSVSGRTDCWVKWSYGDAPVHALVQALMGTANGFVDVEKVRSLRKFSMDRGVPEEVAETAMPDVGCGVELTRLTVRSEAWWTFAFEAFGPPDRVRGILDTVARAYLVTRPPVDAFATANSCSYPGWLAGF